MLGWGIWDTLDGRTIYPLKFFTTTFSSPFQGLMSPVVFNILRGPIIAERYRRKQVILELFKLVVSYQCRRPLLFHLLIEDKIIPSMDKKWQSLFLFNWKSIYKLVLLQINHVNYPQGCLSHMQDYSKSNNIIG
jgi:hypothetical protein